MLELNRAYPSGLLQTDGTYSDLLEKRDEVLRNEAAYQETLANLVPARSNGCAAAESAHDESEGAHQKRDASSTTWPRAATARTSSADIEFTASPAQDQRCGWGRDCASGSSSRTSTFLTPGSRLGILGPNGSGKTTLLRLMTGENEPDAGTIETAHGLRVVYFEQNRESLDPNLTLRRALAPEGDMVMYATVRFTSPAGPSVSSSARAVDTSVSRLSGGEKARIILARLMLKPADLLVMDEPTNDSTSRRWRSSKSRCSSFRARWCSSRTTATCSSACRRRSSRSTATEATATSPTS